VGESKLVYFDFDGGRGEAIRMVLVLAGVNFEDVRISFEQFGQMRENFPLNAVPTLEIGGTVYTQTNAMLRYAGSKANLYPADTWLAFLCDEILDICEDVFHAISKTLYLEGDELKTAREAMVAGPLTRVLKLLEQRLASAEYFVDKKLSVADLKVFLNTRMLLSGMFDHVPVDMVQQVAPSLVSHMERVSMEPKVAEYLKTLT